VAGKQADEFLDFVGGDTMLQQLLRILGERVGAVEKRELTPSLPVEDFRIRTRRGDGSMSGQDHIGVQHGTEMSGHLELRGDVPMAPLQLLE
jgi:hypothetical protein